MNKEFTSKSVARGTGIVACLTLVSRALGLVRDLLVARLFGAGFFTDAFFVAFRIPNLLRSLVGEGALTSAFVPVFAGELKQGKLQAQQTLSAAASLLLTATMILSLLGIIFAPEIVSMTAPGFGLSTPKALLCITLTRIMLPYIMFVSLVAMLNGALNTVGIFGAAPLAQIAMNTVLILGALAAGLLSDQMAVIFLAVSVILGGVAEIIVQIPGMRCAGLTLRPTRHMITPTTMQILKLMLPAVVGAAIYQVAIFINTLLASVLQNGSVSWLFYADRIAQLPIGVFTVALTSVLLPALSTAAVSDNQRLFSDNLINALRYTSFCIIPIAAWLFFYAEPLVSLVFKRGAFSPKDSLATALAVQGMCIGLWAVSCTSITMRAFIARKDTLTPALVGAFGLCFGTLLSLLLMGPPESYAQGWLCNMISSLQRWLTSYLPSLDLGHCGLALSSGLAQMLSLLVLILLLERLKLGISWKPFSRTTYRSLGGAGVMLTGLAALEKIGLTPYVSLFLGGLVGSALYVLSAVILKSPEIQETSSMLARIWKRGR